MNFVPCLAPASCHVQVSARAFFQHAVCRTLRKASFVSHPSSDLDDVHIFLNACRRNDEELFCARVSPFPTAGCLSFCSAVTSAFLLVPPHAEGPQEQR